MAYVFALIFLASVPALAIGLINPKWVLPKSKNPTRSQALKVYGGTFFASLILTGLTAPKFEPSSTVASEATAPGATLKPSDNTPPSAAPQSAGITMNQFNRIDNGMSQSDVERVLGGPGQEMSRVTIPGAPETVMYMWSNKDGSNMNVTLQDDAVVMKAQFGLR